MLYDEIIITGALAYDQILNLPGKFSDYILADKIHNINVSFATDTHVKRFGGTGGNQAYALNLLGIEPILFATAGSDFGPYKKFLTRCNIDCSNIHIIKNELTAMGIAITDEIDNQIWGFSKAAMSYAKNFALTPIIKKSKNPFIMIAPNGFEAMENYIDECISMQVPFAFDPAFYIPTLSKRSLKKGVQHAKIIFGNDYEIELLKSRLSIKILSLQDDQILITTIGEKGSIIQTNRNSIKIKPAKVKRVVDPTGAGDAYRAGFLAGYFQGKDVKTSGQMGSVSAAYAVEQYGTMKHSFTEKEFWKRYKQNYS